MIKYDDILFKNACLKTQDVITSLNNLNSIINEINSIPETYDGKDLVDDAIEILLNLKDIVTNLSDDMLNTLCIMTGASSISDIAFQLNLSNPLGIFEGNVLGEYGANQSYSYLLFKKYLEDPDSLTDIQKKRLDLINQVFEDFQYADLPDVVKKSILYAFHEGGCALSSADNIIVDVYSRIPNGEKLFEEKYGFPLYYVDENGIKRYNYAPLHTKINLNMVSKDLNYDIKDVLKLEGHDKERAYIKYVDDVNTCLSSYTRFRGLTNSEFVNVLKDELGDKYDISTDTESYGNYITGAMSYLGIGDNGFSNFVSDYKNKKEDYDYVVINVHGFTLKPYDEATIEQIGTKELFNLGGHNVILNGISENGYPIVSSWGYKFELTGSLTTDAVYINIGDKNE